MRKLFSFSSPPSPVLSEKAKIGRLTVLLFLIPRMTFELRPRKRVRVKREKGLFEGFAAAREKNLHSDPHELTHLFWKPTLP